MRVLGSRLTCCNAYPAAGGAVGGSAPGKRLQFDKKEDTLLFSLSLTIAALFLGKKGKKTDETETDGEKKKEDREGERERKRNGEGTKEKGRRRKRETGPHFYLRGKRKRPKGVNQAARLAGTLRERHARTSFFPFSSSPRLSHRIFLISLPLLLLCVFFVHDPAVTPAEALFLLARITTILTTVRTRM